MPFLPGQGFKCFTALVSSSNLKHSLSLHIYFLLDISLYMDVSNGFSNSFSHERFQC